MPSPLTLAEPGQTLGSLPMPTGQVPPRPSSLLGTRRGRCPAHGPECPIEFPELLISRNALPPFPSFLKLGPGELAAKAYWRWATKKRR